MQIRRDKGLQRIKLQYSETCSCNREDYFSVVIINPVNGDINSPEGRQVIMTGGRCQHVLISTGLGVHPVFS